MRWDEGHDSDDVVDRRGEGPAYGFGGGGGGGGGLWFLLQILPWLVQSPLGLLVAVGFVGFVGIRALVGGGGTEHASREHAAQASKKDENYHFVSFVLDDTQTTWSRLFEESGAKYRRSKLVLYAGRTRTGCGAGSASMGPFYCPADERTYLDVSFFRELERRYGAPGRFAQAYVIAHEVGHHVQHVLGTNEKLGRFGHQEGADGGSVRLELQADCYAGIWAHATKERGILEPGDFEKAITAAQAIGDDALQRRAQGYEVPESFTHGTSEQRMRWLRRGYEQGTLEACDTIRAKEL
jgi:predicted metalloprotease